jgi:hypothetical protein
MIMAKQRLPYEITPGDEAKRLAYVVDEAMQSGEAKLSPAELIELGKLNALIHLAERIDALGRVVQAK